MIAKLKNWYSQAKNWLCKNKKWVAAGLAFIGAIIVGIIYKSGGKSLLQQKKIEVMTYEREATRLEGQRDMIREREGENSEVIKEIEVRIKAVNDDIVRVRAEVDKMTAEEKLKEFKKLGY